MSRGLFVKGSFLMDRRKLRGPGRRRRTALWLRCRRSEVRLVCVAHDFDLGWLALERQGIKRVGLGQGDLGRTPRNEALQARIDCQLGFVVRTAR
jgi:hypothetical protein